MHFMKYRRLGKTEIKVSVVGIGTWQFGGAWGKGFEIGEVKEMFAVGKELGINFIDTAECYGDHTSERLIGEALEGERDEWVIATKFGHNPGSDNPPEMNWQAGEVKKQLDESLRSLRTDYVDILQFHSGGDDVFDNDELWSMLNEEVKAGRVKHLGISIGSNRNIYQTDKATEVNASVIQVVYNRINKAPEEEVFASCERQDLGILARVPLASGYLSGKYKPGARWEDGDVRHRRNAEDIDKALEEVEEIKANEVPSGVDMASWALAWCLKHPAVTCVIPGCKSAEQVRTNAAAVDLVTERHPQDRE
jgi:aryl-alcohol dehydrogenase-like predicted oxidoreductase